MVCFSGVVGGLAAVSVDVDQAQAHGSFFRAHSAVVVAVYGKAEARDVHALTNASANLRELAMWDGRQIGNLLDLALLHSQHKSMSSLQLPC